MEFCPPNKFQKTKHITHHMLKQKLILQSYVLTNKSNHTVCGDMHTHKHTNTHQEQPLNSLETNLLL